MINTFEELETRMQQIEKLHRKFDEAGDKQMADLYHHLFEDYQHLNKTLHDDCRNYQRELIRLKGIICEAFDIIDEYTTEEVSLTKWKRLTGWLHNHKEIRKCHESKILKM